MTDDFKPFTQVSRRRIRSKLRQINAGKAGLLLWFFVTEMDHLGIVKASYERISDVTGMGAASIASQSRTLVAAGLVERLPDDPNDGISRWQVSHEIARYPSSETKGSNGRPSETEISETKGPTTEIQDVVVKDSMQLFEEYAGDTQQQQALRASFETEISETKDSLLPDPRLALLWEDYGLAEGLAPQVMTGWIDRYGLEKVLAYARCYVHKRRAGEVWSPGWLHDALAQGWVLMDGDYDPKQYMTPEERAQVEAEEWERYKAKLDAYGIMY